MQARLITVLTALVLAGSWTSAMAKVQHASWIQDTRGGRWHLTDAAKARRDLTSAEKDLRQAVQDVDTKSAGKIADDAVVMAYDSEDSTQRAKSLLPRTPFGGAAVYDRSLQRLKEAAQEDRETLQKLAALPVSNKRDEAIHEARQALQKTQDAMLDIAPHVS